MASNDLLFVMMEISKTNAKIDELETKMNELNMRVGDIEKYIDEKLVVTLNELMCKFDSELKELINRM
ncbi:hypothetical protein H9L25_00530 [Terrisporobacter mayombei]|nr:hypothetical protein [Terrisporobacter mayombei]